jgi:hypothetical protein
VQERASGHKAAAGAPGVAAAAPLSADDEALRRGLEAVIGLPVRLQRNRRAGGRVVIDFLDDADLDALYQRLGGPRL